MLSMALFNQKKKRKPPVKTVCWGGGNILEILIRVYLCSTCVGQHEHGLCGYSYCALRLVLIVSGVERF